MKTLLRLLILSFALPASLMAQPTVVSLTLHDTIQPISAGYLSRGLAAAAQRHAVLVVVSLDTPGGLLDSTRAMVATIEHSPVPVAILVSPAGARAASAGFFLLEAADIAAMAPGTNTGAAHPIVNSQTGSRTLDPILKQKIENDAAAFLRSYAGRRGHNAEAAEDAVRNSRSYSDTEALQLHLVNLVVPSTAALLSALDGRTIQRFDGSTTILHLTGATVVEIAPSLRESLLTRLTNPDVAILLLIAGMLLIYLEFNMPGTIIPGALGSLSVLLALFGLGMLPISHIAILLLMAAGALFLVEIKVPSHGVLGLAGVAALVFGLATLVDGPITEMRVHRGVAVAAGIGFSGITLLLAWVAMQARRNKFVMGPQAMVNKLAVTQTALQPSGQVEIRGELWRAILAAEAQPIPAGTEVVVRGIELDGLTLIVDRAGNVQPTAQKS